MSRASRRRLYKSKAWQKCRDAYYISRFGICERCGGPGVIVHHKIPITDENIWDPSITLNFDNLELVCIECHNKEHFGEKVMSDEIAFDEFGNLQKKHPPWAAGMLMLKGTVSGEGSKTQRRNYHMRRQ